MNGVEFKGTTTTDKLAPPTANLADLSKDSVFKAPGEAEKNNPELWEVDSYAFTPGFITA